MEQVQVTGAKATIDVNNWSCFKRVRGKRFAPLRLPYTLEIFDTGGNDGKAGRTGEAHRRRGPTAEANNLVATLPVSGQSVNCCREPVRYGRVCSWWVEGRGVVGGSDIQRFNGVAGGRDDVDVGSGTSEGVRPPFGAVRKRGVNSRRVS